MTIAETPSCLPMLVQARLVQPYTKSLRCTVECVAIAETPSRLRYGQACPVCSFWEPTVHSGARLLRVVPIGTPKKNTLL